MQKFRQQKKNMSERSNQYEKRQKNKFQQILAKIDLKKLVDAQLWEKEEIVSALAVLQRGTTEQARLVLFQYLRTQYYDVYLELLEATF